LPKDTNMHLHRISACLLLAAACATDAQAVGRLADIEIHDRSSGRTLPVYWHDGKAYVAGNPGNEYEVRLRNRASVDLLAVISVDGINALSGQSAGWKQGGYVIDRWTRTDIQGWRKSLSETAAFYFTSLGDSYAARTDRPQNVGVIGVALFERKRVLPQPLSQAAPTWEREESRAADAAGAPAKRDRAQDSASAPAAAAAPPLGTGHGRREDSPAQYVEFERASEAPAEVITIYYDSHRNLVAQGVIPTYGHGRRDPQPFPGGFVPDPR
jgi:hypothetical protein